MNKGFMGDNLEQDPEYKKADDILTSFANEVFRRYQASNPGPQSKGAGHGAGGDASKCPFQAGQAAAAPQPKGKTEPHLTSAIETILGSYEDGTPYFTERQRRDQLSTFVFAGEPSEPFFVLTLRWSKQKEQQRTNQN